MSDAHGHDGGHEIDKMPAGRLFFILAILSALTLGLCLAVIQLFNEQVRNIEGQRAAEGYANQAAYMTEMTSVAEGFGKYEIVKPGGKDKPDQITTRYFVPVDRAKQQMLDNGALLAGTRPGKDWAKSGTSGKIKEWGGLPSPTPRRPDAKKLGDAKALADLKKGPRDHRFSFAVKGEDLLLLGEVPSDDVSKTVEAAAKKTHFGDKVKNKLKVTNAPSKPGFDAAYTRALAALDLMSSGSAKFTAGKLSLNGFVPDANKEKFEALKSQAGGPPMGAVDVASTEVADSCDADFAKLLKRTKIRFATGSADVDPKSDALIGKLSDVAKRCPGTFVIEGHTDDQGAADANKRLSLDRANAVSAKFQGNGIEKARLRAKGFGQERPVSPNDTEAGRKKNRRIEVHIAR